MDFYTFSIGADAGMLVVVVLLPLSSSMNKGVVVDNGLKPREQKTSD